MGTTKEILWISISPESALPRTDSLPPRTTLRSRSRSLRSTKKAELLERKTSLLWQVSCAKEARLTRASTDCWLTEICLASGVEQQISDAKTLTETMRLPMNLPPRRVHLQEARCHERHFLKQFQKEKKTLLHQS